MRIPPQTSSIHSGMLLTDELKESTRTPHQATEKKMVATLKQLRSKEEYIQLLYWLYGFYSPMEDLIGRHLTGNDLAGSMGVPGSDGIGSLSVGDRDDLPYFIGERRSDALLRDIMDSGLPLHHHEDCDHLPVIDSFARALGALYVLEGSALGGRIIAGMIDKQIGLRDSLSFFNGEGAATDKRWQSFKDYLDQPCFNAQRQDILAAAQDTFITFKNWIDKNELQPQL